MLRNFALTAGLIALSLTAACAQDTGEVTPERAATEEIIREYILANPEIVEEALYALEAKRAQAEEDAKRVAVNANAELIFSSDADYSIGPADAPVTVVEFFDYRCGPCRASMATVNALPDRYKGQVRVVFKEFPILSTESRLATLAALAAGRQGKYVEMHQGLMLSPSLEEKDIVKIAEDIGLDMATWRKDREDKAFREQVDRTHFLAQTIGANATPTFIIGDTLFSGLDPNKLETLIAEGIAKAG